MKKILCLSLSVLFCVMWLAGCSLFEHDYKGDYGQVIAVINVPEQEVKGKRAVLDNKGFPTYDVYGNPVMEDVKKTYTPDKIEIYKYQLVNYTNYYLGNDLQSKTAEVAIKGYADTLINIELLLIEADKLFDAGILYWTVAEVEEIQRAVYTTITDSIFTEKNKILENNDLPKITAKGTDPATASTTYPVPPEEMTETVSPRYPVAENPDDNHWFDSWYTDHKWYIEEDNYKTAYPGLYGNMRDRNLAAEAFINYFEGFIQQAEQADNLVGATKKQQEKINQQIDELKEIRRTKGIEFVFPEFGKTLAAKLLVGNSSLKNAKLKKLQDYVIKKLSTDSNTKISDEDVQDYYNELLKNQKKKFVKQSNYDTAVSSGTDPILYYPSNRYVFVKHILLPFSDAQKMELENIKKREGDNEEKIIEERAKLARKIEVYPHVNGENDLSNKRTVAQVTHEITSIMDSLAANPFEAERAFENFIYKYNTDPGIFNKETGYAVVYKLNEAAGETETYMTEFAEATRALRDKSEVGGIFYDDEITDEKGKPVPYCITDYGIHIMYYLMDPSKNVDPADVDPAQNGDKKKLTDYVTPGRYSKIYDLMESGALTKKQNGIYELWEDRYISDYSSEYTTKKDNVISDYIKEINKQINS